MVYPLSLGLKQGYVNSHKSDVLVVISINLQASNFPLLVRHFPFMCFFRKVITWNFPSRATNVIALTNTFLSFFQVY
jgi:hypothetical protein